MQAIQLLTEINLDDLVSSFGWQDRPVPAKILRTLFHFPARKFAQLMLELDSVCGRKSLPEAAKHTLGDFAQGLQVFGMDNVPQKGPVMFLSNHPGMVDTLALFSAINRPDLRIIALNRPFLISLPNIARHLFFISDDAKQRLHAVRRTADHLRSGGAVLTFPAGKIEPDPVVYQGADLSLNEWTDSAGIFIRLAPETKIIPTLVSGVLWKNAVRFPLTKIKNTREEREKLGAALQLLAHVLVNVHPLKVKIKFAQPITLQEINSKDPVVAHSKVMQRMQGLLADDESSNGNWITIGLK